MARLSADVDVIVDLGRRSATELVAALAAAGFELRIPDAACFAEATRVLPFVHGPSRMPLDVVLAGPGLEGQVFAGAARETWTTSPPSPACAAPASISRRSGVHSVSSNVPSTGAT